MTSRRQSGPLSKALTAALRDAQVQAQDKAAVALAKRLAALMDEAQALADALDDVEPENTAEARTLRALKARVDAHTVASDLAPKLLAALQALGMTPAARNQAAKGGATSGSADGGGNPLGKLISIGGAAARQHAS